MCHLLSTDILSDIPHSRWPTSPLPEGRNRIRATLGTGPCQALQPDTQQGSRTSQNAKCLVPVHDNASRRRFMNPCSIGPCPISPNGSWVIFTMSPFVMIGPFFILCFFEGTNQTCLIYPTKIAIFLIIILFPSPGMLYYVIVQLQSTLLLCVVGRGGAIN
jgi:hypothetical protein